MDNATCPLCLIKFCSVSSKNQHLKFIHKVEMESKKISRILCPLCPDTNREVIATNTVLIEHLRNRHHVLIEEEKLTFPKREDFENWKQLEHRNVDYITDRTTKKEFKKVILYNCNQSNSHGVKSKCSKRTEKNGGSIKIDGMCPSRITADFYFDGKVEVYYIKTHVGHNEDLRARRLTPEEQKVIAEKMKAGVSVDRIIEDAQKLQDEKVERINVLIREDCRYIRKKYNIENLRDPNDKNYALMFKQIDAEMKSEESDHFCIEEESEEKLKLKENEDEFINEIYQDLNNKENQEENIDDETRKKIRWKETSSMVNYLMNNLDMATINKLFNKIDTVINEFLPNISAKRKMETQHYYPQTQKKQKKQ